MGLLELERLLKQSLVQCKNERIKVAIVKYRVGVERFHFQRFDTVLRLDDLRFLQLSSFYPITSC